MPPLPYGRRIKPLCCLVPSTTLAFSVSSKVIWSYDLETHDEERARLLQLSFDNQNTTLHLPFGLHLLDRLRGVDHV